MKLETLLAAALLFGAVGCDRTPTTAIGTAQAAPLSSAGGERLIQVSLVLPPEAEPILPQAVKDLGLSAKRDQLTWTIGGEKLHSAIAQDGKMFVHAVKREAGDFDVKLSARWPGAKDEAAQREIAERLIAIGHKMAQFVGHPSLEVACLEGAPDALRPCAL